jgi:hypothetical protein
MALSGAQRRLWPAPPVIDGRKVVKIRAELRDELRLWSKQRRDENIAAHRARNARILRGRARRSRLGPQAAAPSTPLDLVAIGDSWFEYPLYDNGPWPEETGIVAPVQLQSMGNPPPQILNLAQHGDATTAMLSWENQQTLQSELEDGTWLNPQTNLPDAILVSAGGDDVVGDQFVIYLDNGGGGLNVDRFKGALASVQASYEDLFAFRSLFAPGVPIIGHCYDYALPNGLVPAFVEEAWLQPSLDFAGYDYAEGVAIVKTMIDMVHDMFAGLAAQSRYNFTLIDTRGTIAPDTTSPTGWANEIHPRFGGFTALAAKFLAVLQAKFPGRV